MRILFEDKDIIACIKPVGLLSQSDKDGSDSMVALLEQHTGGVIYPIHRLDRETGGVMAYAKTKNAAAKLSRDIAEHRFNKEYLAIAHGKPTAEEDTLCDLLFKDSRKNKSYIVARERKGVKSAKLYYRMLANKTSDGEVYSLLLIRLFTGRTHQIRVQLSHRKMPLAGDRKYGAHDDFSTLGLWSYKLELTHPTSGEMLKFISLPIDSLNSDLGFEINPLFESFLTDLTFFD